MRITTKVMQNNSLSNINTNKMLQDKLNTQMATEKKINRPSDDPVVAIRALRLRTNVSQVTQYYEKNAPDAESWLKVTEDALTNVSSVIEDMIEQCTKGANENLTSADRNTILDALKALRDEVYATGNADYAGRSVFTGYRTESTLKFTADTQKTYSITENMTTANIDKITHVKSGNLNSINDANYKDTDYADIKEAQVETSSIYRIRLGYSDICKEYGIEEKYVECDYSFESGLRKTKELIKKYPDVDGIIASNDMVAISIYKVISKKGYRVPEDIQIIGFDNISFSWLSTPEITTIAQPIKKMGKKAAQIIIQHKKGEEIEKENVFDVKLIQRQTTKIKG